MPPAPPVRPGTHPYHFHTYDFARSQPFTASPAQWLGYGWQFYSLRQDLNGLAQIGTGAVPNLAAVPVQVGGATTQGRRTLMLSFGNAAGGAAPTVVITGGIHAREWIAAEVAYLIAEYLIVNYIRAPGLNAATNGRLARLRNLVDTRNIRIIPMLNPDGNNTTVFGWYPGSRMWRKNLRVLPRWKSTWITELAPLGVVTPPFANVQSSMLAWASYDVPDYDPTHGVPAGAAPGAPVGAVPNYQNHQLSNVATGVDLNRNMGTTGWGYDPGGDGDPSGESYFGTRPGGETETANLQVAMNNAALVGAGGNIDTAIDYHSFGRLILYPTEAVYRVGGVNQIPAAYQRLGQALDLLIVDNTGQHYDLGTARRFLGYDTTGAVDDRAAQQHQARAFTVELDPAGNPDPGDQGFVLQENQIQGVFETNIRGALAAIAAPTAALATIALSNELNAWPVHGAGNQVP